MLREMKQRRGPAGQKRWPVGQKRGPVGQRRGPAGQKRGPVGQRRGRAGQWDVSRVLSPWRSLFRYSTVAYMTVIKAFLTVMKSLRSSQNLSSKES